MRTTSEIVSYLTRYYQSQSSRIEENLLPEHVNHLVNQMDNFLENKLEEGSPHQAVWDDFSEHPGEHAASVTGVLEAVFEAQPAVRKRITGFTKAITAIESLRSDAQDTGLYGTEKKTNATWIAYT